METEQLNYLIIFILLLFEEINHIGQNSIITEIVITVKSAYNSSLFPSQNFSLKIESFFNKDAQKSCLIIVINPMSSCCHNKQYLLTPTILMQSRKLITSIL